MKTFLLLALLPLTTFARNGNDGPSAVPQPPHPPRVSVIAQVTQACGFMCPDGRYNGVRIQADGQVLRVEGNRSGEKEELLARLEPASVAKLQKRADEIELGELKDTTPGKPECMDGPTTTYQIERNGIAQKIQQNYGCHEHVLPSRDGRELVQLLNGFSAL